MIRYIIRRLLQAIPTIFGITIFTYLLLSAAGNPVAQLTFRPGVTAAERERVAASLGVNDALPIQYLRWLLGDDWMRWDSDGDGAADRNFLLPLDANGDGEPEAVGTRQGVLRGDFGLSFTQRRPVMDIFWERLPATLEVSITALIIGTIVGVIIGILAAVRRGGIFDNISRVLAVVFDAVPNFWLAIMLLLIVSVQWGLTPIGDRCEFTLLGDCPPIWERWNYMVLPVFVLATGAIASYSRFMRASMLDIMNQDYIRTARAKGLAQRAVWFKHAARNALIPIATFLGPSIAFFWGGSVITEQIFNYPGIGLTFFQAAGQRDYPMIMAVTVLGSIATVLGYLLSDVLYAVVDPRIRFN